MDEIVLASASPRRKELLELLGLPFRVQPANHLEAEIQGESPQALVRRLSREKGCKIASHLHEGIVISADTIVVLDNVILGKPDDALQARTMLRALRGRIHHVLSAIAIIRVSTGEMITDVSQETVEMRMYSADEMEAYLATGDPLDKAGAYAIQHSEFRPVKRIEGCYASVVGLPLCHLYRALETLGVSSAKTPAAGCAEQLGFTCQIYPSILSPASLSSSSMGSWPWASESDSDRHIISGRPLRD